MIFFIAVCITSFLLTKTQFEKGMLKQFAGVINAIIIGTTNYLYRTATTPLVKLENIKYEEDYNNSLT